MYDNFLGTPFEDWVKDQIDTRQKSLGVASNITSQDLQYYTTKTPFLRLASSVSLTNPSGENNNSVLSKLIATGYNEESIRDNQLARNFILQGGVTSVDGEDVFGGLQKGLNDGSSLFNGAYGWGGTSERGYVPMPGITQADVTYYNNGALSKTVINVRCFSKTQFQLFDVLYLRPGYTLLMEFGWSQYLDSRENPPVLTNFPDFYTNPMSLVLGQGITNQYAVYDAIKETRETHCGNYEAVFGKISKFNWQFLPDGSYDCQIQLTAVGDVLESLKCNISPPPVQSSSIGISSPQPQSPDAVAEGPVEEDLTPPYVANKRKTLIGEELFTIYNNNKELENNDIVLKDYTVTDYLDDKGTPGRDILFPKSLLIVPMKSTTSGDDAISPQIFIKYGAFLAFIQSRVLLYSTTTDTPLFTFNINFEDMDNDNNVILNIPGQLSSDPNVCLIPYETCNVGDVGDFPPSDLNDVLKETNFKYNDDIYLGRFANIMVNINFLQKILDQYTKDSEGTIVLLDYLKSINKDIIISLGGINKFEFKLADNGLGYQIIEDIPQRLSEPPRGVNYSKFNVYGVKPGIEGSFVRNINLTADISNDFYTMISIGAQSNPNQTAGNATSFANYNAGLIDRVIPEKSSYDLKDTNTEEEKESQKVWKDTNLLIKPINQLYGELKWVNETITSFTSNNLTNTELALGILTDATNTRVAQQLPAPFFLPFNLSLDIDGLSGMVLYQKFKMTDEILPISYEKDAVALQLTGINHSISKDGWITKLDTLSVPNVELGEVIQPPTDPFPPFFNNEPPLPPTSEPPVPETEQPDSPTRREAMLTSYDGVFSRDGEVKGMCARWTLNLAAGYVNALQGQSIPSQQVSAGGNANNNNEYYNNLTRLGYSKTTLTGLSKSGVISKITGTTWGYGDVVAYYANDGDPQATHKKYGHTQIYVGDINSPKWATSTKLNYNTDFPYRTRPSNSWNLIIFRAPEE